MQPRVAPLPVALIGHCVESGYGVVGDDGIARHLDPAATRKVLNVLVVLVFGYETQSHLAYPRRCLCTSQVVRSRGRPLRLATDKCRVRRSREDEVSLERGQDESGQRADGE